jgi:signal transduction histidine kinase
LVRHRWGSLETVVAADRRRNLLLSFGVLLVLAVSMAMIIISTQRARRLAHLQMEFVAGVSHELRTPVAVICSAADNLAEGFVGGKDQVKEYGAVIRNEGRRLAGMIEQILHFAAGQAGRVTYDLQPVQVSEAIADALANVSRAARGRGLHHRARYRSGPAAGAGRFRRPHTLPAEPGLERREVRRRKPLGSACAPKNQPPMARPAFASASRTAAWESTRPTGRTSSSRSIAAKPRKPPRSMAPVSV